MEVKKRGREGHFLGRESSVWKGGLIFWLNFHNPYSNILTLDLESWGYKFGDPHFGSFDLCAPLITLFSVENLEWWLSDKSKRSLTFLFFKNPSPILSAAVKARLHTALQKNEDFDAQDYEILARGGSLGSKSIYKAMKFVRNPTKMCERIANLIADMLQVIKNKSHDPKCQNDVLYHQESWDLMYRRWVVRNLVVSMIIIIPVPYSCIHVHGFFAPPQVGKTEERFQNEEWKIRHQ